MFKHSPEKEPKIWHPKQWEQPQLQIGSLKRGRKSVVPVSDTLILCQDFNIARQKNKLPQEKDPPKEKQPCHIAKSIEAHSPMLPKARDGTMHPPSATPATSTKRVSSVQTSPGKNAHEIIERQYCFVANEFINSLFSTLKNLTDHVNVVVDSV